MFALGSRVCFTYQTRGKRSKGLKIRQVPYTRHNVFYIQIVKRIMIQDILHQAYTTSHTMAKQWLCIVTCSQMVKDGSLFKEEFFWHIALIITGKVIQIFLKVIVLLGFDVLLMQYYSFSIHLSVLSGAVSFQGNWESLPVQPVGRMF